MLKVRSTTSHPELREPVTIEFESYAEDYRSVIIDLHSRLEAQTGLKFDINKLSASVR